MGKSSKEPQAPEIKIPSAAELAQQAIDVQLANAPKLLEAYQKYGPEYSKVMTQTYIDAMKRAPEAYPELYSVLQPLSQAVSGRVSQIGQDIPDNLLQPFRENLRSAQAARGFAESPISAASEAQFLATTAEDFKRQYVNEGLDFVSRASSLPKVYGSEVGLDTVGVDMPSSASIMQTGAQLAPLSAEAQMANYNTQLAAYQKKQQNQWTNLATLGGAGLGFITGAMGGPVGAVQGAQIGRSLATGGTFF